MEQGSKRSMKPKKKDRDQRIQEAVNALNKALAVEHPEVMISFPCGNKDDPLTQAMAKSLKTFLSDYKKYFEYYFGKTPRVKLTM